MVEDIENNSNEEVLNEESNQDFSDNEDLLNSETEQNIVVSEEQELATEDDYYLSLDIVSIELSDDDWKNPDNYVEKLNSEVQETETILDNVLKTPKPSNTVLVAIISYTILILWVTTTFTIIDSVGISQNLFDLGFEGVRFLWFIPDGVSTGLIWVNTTTGGVVSALVISVLATTKPGDVPSNILGERGITRQYDENIRQLDWRVKHLDMKYINEHTDPRILGLSSHRIKLHIETRDAWAKYFTIRREANLLLRTDVQRNDLSDVVKFFIDVEHYKHKLDMLDYEENMLEAERNNLAKEYNKKRDEADRNFHKVYDKFRDHSNIQHRDSAMVTLMSNRETIKNYLVWIYLILWFGTGLGALIVGVVIAPDGSETLAALGTSWLGLAVASAFTYFGIDTDKANNSDP